MKINEKQIRLKWHELHLKNVPSNYTLLQGVSLLTGTLTVSKLSILLASKN